jgi:hypothetical protein
MSFWGDFVAQYDCVVIYAFFLPHVRAMKRIGPHSWEFCQIAVGLLLSDAQAEKHGNSVRLCFQQESHNGDFFNVVNCKLYDMGYISSDKPRLYQRFNHANKLRYYYRLNTFTFSSLTWIHDLFYMDSIKRIHPELEFFLTPISLAYWIAGDGTRVNRAFSFCTNNFSKPDCELLVQMLQRKFNLSCSIQNAGDLKKAQYRIYVKVGSMPRLRTIVLPHLHPSMYYKLGICN